LTYCDTAHHKKIHKCMLIVAAVCFNSCHQVKHVQSKYLSVGRITLANYNGERFFWI
jgi:hypothetical protein